MGLRGGGQSRELCSSSSASSSATASNSLGLPAARFVRMSVGRSSTRTASPIGSGTAAFSCRGAPKPLRCLAAFPMGLLLKVAKGS